MGWLIITLWGLLTLGLVGWLIFQRLEILVLGDRISRLRWENSRLREANTFLAERG